MTSSTTERPAPQILTGEDSERWFRDRDVRVSSAHRIRLYSDEIIGGSEFRLARIWHSPAELALSTPPGCVLLVLQVEGSLEVTPQHSEHPGPGGATRRLELRDLAILPPATRFSFAATENSARYELTVSIDALPPSTAAALASGGIRRAEPGPMQAVLLSAATEALNQRPQPEDPGFAFLQLALTDIAGGVLFEALRVRSSGRFARPDELRERAEDAILLHAGDPDFSVTDLASVVEISADYLFRVFRTVGVTPAQAIRRRRVTLAHAHLERRAGGSALTRDDIARLSGFRSAEALRRALRGEAAHRSTASDAADIADVAER
ncbi:AraC family transcriptional regulator [Rathayibacter tanaceti]|uniref:Helix-turn-helix domain-containing protein n=2 Tax=Rathayibacter tanaceti TaxID=1671680 RepID=A0A166HXP0_9MICO|nr:helix-turn-helix domain-containing protein [Rathayibacter tanaceti]KZX21312.1 transcriptional activator FtrA [Rathayibacter tanaceti]QHC54276.1 helix-turn-helix domain-containing protein [Rathayibacter tanaceti]TCO37954.1 helix-turn-helix protein [Rathayibacter tanaceti]